MVSTIVEAGVAQFAAPFNWPLLMLRIAMTVLAFGFAGLIFATAERRRS